jgi:hypothetical protein
MNFGHTPYDTMPWWQERSFWNLWGPRALARRLRGLPLPSKEFESEGVAFEAMGAPHQHPATQSTIEKKVRENAAILEDASYGYRPAIGFQANRLMPPVDGPTYGSDMNTFPEGTPTTPNSPIRFTREYERRGGGFSKLENIEKPEDVMHFDANEAAQKMATIPPKNNDVPHAFQSAPIVSVTV